MKLKKFWSVRGGGAPRRLARSTTGKQQQGVEEIHLGICRSDISVRNAHREKTRLFTNILKEKVE